MRLTGRLPTAKRQASDRRATEGRKWTAGRVEARPDRVESMPDRSQSMPDRLQSIPGRVERILDRLEEGGSRLRGARDWLEWAAGRVERICELVGALERTAERRARSNQAVRGGPFRASNDAAGVASRVLQKPLL